MWKPVVVVYMRTTLSENQVSLKKNKKLITWLVLTKKWERLFGHTFIFLIIKKNDGYKSELVLWFSENFDYVIKEQPDNPSGLRAICDTCTTLVITCKSV